MEEMEEERTGLGGVIDLLLMPWRILRQEGQSLVDFARETREAATSGWESEADSFEAYLNPEVERSDA